MSKYTHWSDNMVRNYFAEIANAKVPCDYTKEELFAVIEYWSGTSDYAEQLEAVIEDVKGGVKR